MRVSRRLSVFLMISIGLNLFFVGMLATQRLADPPSGIGGPFNRHAAYAALGDEHREVVRRIWDRNQTENRDKLDRVRDLRERLRDELTAGTFDKTALEASFEALRDTMIPLSSGVFTIISEIAETLPPDARRRYFETGFAGARARQDPLSERLPPEGAGES